MSHIPNYIEYTDEPLALEGFGSRLAVRHVFEKDDVEAVNAALAARRPLLVRGEPGAGKSQLARAAAAALGRAFVGTVVDARTESRDLLWSFDAVRRLAEAQVYGAVRRSKAGDEPALAEEAQKEADDPLDERNYTAPGPLWWAFDWDDASRQAGRSRAATPPIPARCSPEEGVVVLVDEIDKADSSVPNGLLGSLGDGFFDGPGGQRVKCGEIEPLVMVTTNEERSLPDAFLRRCLVHKMSLPSGRQGLYEWLVRRGRAHFGEGLDQRVLDRAAELLAGDRESYREIGLAPPGGAEYLDLLRVVAERGDGLEEQLSMLEEVSKFVLHKHPGDSIR